jgi:hypothetical protein
LARREGGGRKGNDNFVAMIAGGVAATILDFWWNSSGAPGSNSVIGYVTSKKGKKVPITTADYAQLGISTLLGLYGFLRAGTGSRIPAFSFGMGATQIITKFIFATSGVPRYIAFDIDAQGRLVPTRTFG